jgi:hypothetical protein
MVRRLAVLAVLGVLAFGIVRLFAALLGGDNGSASGSEQPGAATTVASTRAAATGPSSTVAGEPRSTSSTAAPTTGPAMTGPPTADNPALVYIAGDSDAGTFGPYLDQLLADDEVVDVELDYEVSSGLARPDFYDWPARFDDQVPALDPDVVVVTFGGNDSQGLTDGSGEFIVGDPTQDTADWKREYGKRVGEVMDQLSADGRTLIWVGIPNDDNPDVTARLKVQDDTVRAEAAKRPDVVFIDTWNRFSGVDGNFAEYVVDPRDGQGKDVRAEDGFHLNETGAEILALDIAEAIRAELRQRGAVL